MRSRPCWTGHKTIGTFATSNTGASRGEMHFLQAASFCVRILLISATRWHQKLSNEYENGRLYSPSRSINVHVLDVQVCAPESLVPGFSFIMLSKRPPRSYPRVEVMNEYEQPFIAVVVPVWLHELRAQRSCSSAIGKERHLRFG